MQVRPPATAGCHVRRSQRDGLSRGAEGRGSADESSGDTIPNSEKLSMVSTELRKYGVHGAQELWCPRNSPSVRDRQEYGRFLYSQGQGVTAKANPPGHGCVFGSSTGSPSAVAAVFRSASAETRISSGTCNRTSRAAASCTAS